MLRLQVSLQWDCQSHLTECLGLCLAGLIDSLKYVSVLKANLNIYSFFFFFKQLHKSWAQSQTKIQTFIIRYLKTKKIHFFFKLAKFSHFPGCRYCSSLTRFWPNYSILVPVPEFPLRLQTGTNETIERLLLGDSAILDTSKTMKTSKQFVLLAKQKTQLRMLKYITHQYIKYEVAQQ